MPRPFAPRLLFVAFSIAATGCAVFRPLAPPVVVDHREVEVSFVSARTIEGLAGGRTRVRMERVRVARGRVVGARSDTVTLAVEAWRGLGSWRREPIPVVVRLGLSDIDLAIGERRLSVGRTVFALVTTSVAALLLFLILMGMGIGYTEAT